MEYLLSIVVTVIVVAIVGMIALELYRHRHPDPLGDDMLSFPEIDPSTASEPEKVYKVPGSIAHDTVWPIYEQPRPRFKPAPTMIDATPVAATSEKID